MICPGTSAKRTIHSNPRCDEFQPVLSGPDFFGVGGCSVPTIFFRVDKSIKLMYDIQRLPKSKGVKQNHWIDDWLGVWNMNFMTFHSVGIFIIPTDEVIFFREVYHQPDDISTIVSRYGRRIQWFVAMTYDKIMFLPDSSGYDKVYRCQRYKLIRRTPSVHFCTYILTYILQYVRIYTHLHTYTCCPE